MEFSDKIKTAGILLPVASLPGNYAIGDFGPSAYQWIDALRSCGCSTWQILPINPLGAGNSPYQPASSWAIEERYISPELLWKDGYLPELPVKRQITDRIDYDAAYIEKNRLFEQAVSLFQPDDEYRIFSTLRWVREYAGYRAEYELNHNQDRKQWRIEYSPEMTDRKEQIMYDVTVRQYLLRKQWYALRAYAKRQGITIFGDIPFYVGPESTEVYYHPEEFLLDENGCPAQVAGVPGDQFNVLGQLWGNPLYDWEHMSENGYAFWLDRMAAGLDLYDRIRIDHFRAFDTYWMIPAGALNALGGQWKEAPGDAVLSTIFETYPFIQLAAEDLGYLRPETYALKDRFHLPGMRIIQYDLDHMHFPEDRYETILYTGTHDNLPLGGWLNSLDDSIRRPLLEELASRYEGMNAVRAMIAYVLDSSAGLAVISMPDIMELKENARINTPGTSGSPNWEWRCVSFERLFAYRELIKRSRRFYQNETD